MPLTPAHEHAWDLSPAAARALQAELAGRAEATDRFGAITLVAGIDIGFEQANRVARAAVAVLRLADLALVEQAIARRPTRFPYVRACCRFARLPRPSTRWRGSGPPLIWCCEDPGPAAAPSLPCSTRTR